MTGLKGDAGGDHPTRTEKVNYIPVAEFREMGFLQEANRLFFHPMGLALEIVVEDCENCGGRGDPRTVVRKGEPKRPCTKCEGRGTTERLGGIWDYRDDEEGMVYGEEMLDPEKARIVRAERERHRAAREKMFGSVVQPIEPE